MSVPLKPLDQQVILITGASSGIGLVTAKRAAARGARVMLVARNGEALARSVRDIEAAGGEADFAVADVGDAEAVRAAADKTLSRWGRLDTWVNNAGITIFAKLTETPSDEHERMMRTNYFGVVNGATVAVPLLRERGGALITVASITADIPTPILGAYSATKHAVKGYIESLRMELTADRVPISVTLIKPSGIDTPIAQHAANHVRGEARIPPPVYAPELVAEAILDAAEHPRRDVTVGGAGRAQVLFGVHFPALLDRLSAFLIPLTSDPGRAKTPGSALFASRDAGRERSGVEHALETSLYTAALRHPGAGAALGLVVAAGVLGALLARRHRDASRQW